MNKTMRKDKPNMKTNVNRIISRSKKSMQPNISMGRRTGNKMKYEEHRIDKALNQKQSFLPLVLSGSILKYKGIVYIQLKEIRK